MSSYKEKVTKLIGAEYAVWLDKAYNKEGKVHRQWTDIVDTYVISLADCGDGVNATLRLLERTGPGKFIEHAHVDYTGKYRINSPSGQANAKVHFDMLCNLVKNKRVILREIDFSKVGGVTTEVMKEV